MPGVPRGTESQRTRALRTAAAGLALAAAAGLGAGGCGGHGAAAGTRDAPPPTVDVYSSLPLQGGASAQASAIVHGIQLALTQAGGRAGRWTVDYRSLDDSTAAAGGWDASQTAANASQAGADPRAVYYIGDLESGATEVSLPVLNRAGIAQVSPASSYSGLTSAGPAAAPGEPARFYPTGVRSFMRLVPADPIEAAAGLMAMRQAGCQAVAVISDSQLDGQALAKALTLEQGLYGINLVGDTVLAAGGADPATVAATVKSQGADCVYLAASPSSATVQVTAAIHSVLPRARIIAGSALCTAPFTSAAEGGVPADVAALIQCTLPTPDLATTASGRAFLSAYRVRFGAPDPYAVYGYEAMKLALSAIARLGRRGGERAAVLRALLNTRGRASLFGSYGFAPSGETTVRSYSIYRIGPGGLPRFVETVTPALGGG